MGVFLGGSGTGFGSGDWALSEVPPRRLTKKTSLAKEGMRLFFAFGEDELAGFDAAEDFDFSVRFEAGSDGADFRFAVG